MKHLGTLSGEGILVSNEQDAGPVKYRIDVYEDRNMRSGSGTIYGAEMMLMTNFAKIPHILRLENGEEMGIVIARSNGNRAEIKSSGAIPGF